MFLAKAHKERDFVRRPCVALISLYQEMGRFDSYPFFEWVCPPDVGKVPIHVAAKFKKDGYRKGNFDMIIIAADELDAVVHMIEFQYGSNGYTAEQKMVADSSKGTPVFCVKIKSVDEFDAHLNKYFIK